MRSRKVRQKGKETSMRRLALLAVLAAACGPYNSWVPLEVDWTFGGHTCDQAGVARMQIDIAGEVLTPNSYSCTEAQTGAALGDFLVGYYDVTVTGFDASGNVIFQSTRTVYVHPGSANVITFDAAPTTGTISLRWTFNGQSCGAAGVSSVRVSLDGTLITDANNNSNLPCTSGGVAGTTIGPLAPGSHSISLAASSSSTNYVLDGVSATVAAGQDTQVPADLKPTAATTASADVSWLFEPGDQSCAAVGADHLYIVFDPASDGSGGTVVADTACTGIAGPVSEIQIVDVPDGSHSFAVRATQSNHLLAYTHHPVSTIFSAPITTPVHVTLEGLP
jgi:hypothetical protein